MRGADAFQILSFVLIMEREGKDIKTCDYRGQFFTGSTRPAMHRVATKDSIDTSLMLHLLWQPYTLFLQSQADR